MDRGILIHRDGLSTYTGTDLSPAKFFLQKQPTGYQSEGHFARYALLPLLVRRPDTLVVNYQLFPYIRCRDHLSDVWSQEVPRAATRLIFYQFALPVGKLCCWFHQGGYRSERSASIVHATSIRTVHARRRVSAHAPHPQRCGDRFACRHHLCWLDGSTSS